MRVAAALAIALALEVRAAGPPLGLDLYMPVPSTNPITMEKIRLGRRLFFDKRLSRDGTMACSTCHDPRLAFTDGRVVSRGVGGARGTRNAPAILNRGWGEIFFWDGRAKSLEQQVLEPIFNPKELGLDRAELERRTGLKTAAVSASLATYVRTIRAGDSAYDRYTAGNPAALKPLEKTGLDLFRGKANCSICHTGPNFTDERLHNTGVAFRDGALVDKGAANGTFKTPTLRQLSGTAPYMHDGSILSLGEVVEFYSQGGRANPGLDSEMRRLALTSEEKQALVAFLRSLTGTIREGRL